MQMNNFISGGIISVLMCITGFLGFVTGTQHGAIQVTTGKIVCTETAKHQRVPWICKEHKI